MHCRETVLKQPGGTCRTFKSAEAKSLSLQGKMVCIVSQTLSSIDVKRGAITRVVL